MARLPPVLIFYCVRKMCVYNQCHPCHSRRVPQQQQKVGVSVERRVLPAPASTPTAGKISQVGRVGIRN